MDDDSLGAVFDALGSPVRRQILDIIKDKPGCSVKHVSGFFEMSRIGVMKHLKILVDSGLIISEKSGRDRKMYLNTVPIQMIYDRWTTEYSAIWASNLTKVKYKIESAEKKSGRG
jgi:predicted transcriptional regulator